MTGWLSTSLGDARSENKAYLSLDRPRAVWLALRRYGFWFHNQRSHRYRAVDDHALLREFGFFSNF